MDELHEVAMARPRRPASIGRRRSATLGLAAAVATATLLLGACGDSDGRQDDAAASIAQTEDSAEPSEPSEPSESSESADSTESDESAEPTESQSEPASADGEPAKASDDDAIGDEASGSERPEEGAVETLFPDVLDATFTPEGDRTFTVAVTLSSPYDSPERYADAWRVTDLDGNELGIRILTHDHASEQPFTRSQSGIEIPEGVDVVRIEGRDQVSGWGGETLDVSVPS